MIFGDPGLDYRPGEDAENLWPQRQEPCNYGQILNLKASTIEAIKQTAIQVCDAIEKGRQLLKNDGGVASVRDVIGGKLGKGSFKKKK